MAHADTQVQILNRAMNLITTEIKLKRKQFKTETKTKSLCENEN